MAIQGLDGASTGLRRLFRPLSIAASGLSAQMRRMDVIAQNLANAETTRTADGGGPYRRQVVQLEAADESLATDRLGSKLLDSSRIGSNVVPDEGFSRLMRPDGVRVTGTAQADTPGRMEYIPGHPDANEAGYVEFPNVNIDEEFADLMSARRVFEANATVFQVAKAALRRALEI